MLCNYPPLRYSQESHTITIMLLLPSSVRYRAPFLANGVPRAGYYLQIKEGIVPIGRKLSQIGFFEVV